MKDIFTNPLPNAQFKDGLKEEVLTTFRTSLSSKPHHSWIKRFFSSGQGLTLPAISFVIVLFFAVTLPKGFFFTPNENLEISFADFDSELSDISVLIQEDPEVQSAINFEIL